MVWICLYLAIGFFYALANAVSLSSKGQLAGKSPGSIILFFAFFVVFWPAMLIYQYTL